MILVKSRAGLEELFINWDEVPAFIQGRVQSEPSLISDDTPIEVTEVELKRKVIFSQQVTLASAIPVKQVKSKKAKKTTGKRTGKKK